MHLSLRLARLAAVTAVVLILAACASLDINSFVERGVDFRQYRTYGWGPSDTWSTGDPRLDNNEFFHESVQAHVEQELVGRGFERATSGLPDLLIHYHTSITQLVEPNSVDQEYGYCEDCKPYVYDAGSLVIDLVDTRTNKLVWRGWAKGSLQGVVDDQERMEKTIDAAVARILEQLPGAL